MRGNAARSARGSDGSRTTLAVNYSPAALRALRNCALRNSTPAALDVPAPCWKCPPWPAVVHEARASLPVFVHFDLHLGNGATDPLRTPESGAFAARTLDGVAQLRQLTGTRWVNAHLAPSATGARSARAVDAVREDLELLAGRFGAEALAIENVPWERRPDFPIARRAADPSWMCALLQEFPAGLILDLAHARLAALELGRPVRELVAAHPLDRLVELHVAGVGRDAAGRLRDSMPLADEDWELVTWALDEVAAGRWSRPWAVVLEYGGVGPHFAWRCDEGILGDHCARLAELLRERALC